MSSGATGRSTLILSRHWKAADSELSFVTRALAGAASRTTEVTVVVPSEAGRPQADGAFDLLPAGVGPEGGWPDPPDGPWIAAVQAGTNVIVDEIDTTARALLRRLPLPSSVHTVAPSASEPGSPGEVALRFTGSSATVSSDSLGLHVPINPLAATHRHNGLGFTDYLLVLSDRVGMDTVAPPTPMAAWLTARFPDAHVVVVEDASAAVWRGRALRGVVSVDTRTDLWRLLAHAHLTVDLAPGPVIARECIESLRFGTPIVVPSTSAALDHAAAGGGLAYAGYAELLECVERLGAPTVRATTSDIGRRYADSQYGDPAAFVARVARVLTS
jgi:hypothetical protein